MKRQARIIVVAPDYEGIVELPTLRVIPHAEDWPQGTPPTSASSTPRPLTRARDNAS